MLLPAMIFLVIFTIKPLLGSVLAFKKLNPVKGIWGSEWVGLYNFKVIFDIPNIDRILYNTVFIAVMKIIAQLIIPLAFALILNEVRKLWFKRFVQTVVYLPYFLSWVILAGIFRDIFAMDGVINKISGTIFGTEPVMFLGSNLVFPFLMVGTETWKNFGFNAIIYLAALTNISPNLYEACDIDGGNRWKQLLHITMPGIKITIVLLATLSLQSVLNAGFEQILNFYNPLVYESGDILDTYIYRMGLQNNQFEMATALGLVKSAVGFILILIAQKLAGKFAGYRIF
ncbi:MAG TPA: ABC transporter permease subunit [Ruminiclostridium sp.]